MMKRTSQKAMSRKVFVKTLLAVFAVLLLGTSAFAQKVNINSASREELQELPGVGPKLADSIVTDRDENGPFTSVEDLARVDGVSSGLVQKLFDMVHVGGRKRVGGVVLREGEAIDASAVRKVLQRFQGEPTIREVQKAAVAYSNSHPELIESMRTRARLAAAAPEFRVRGDGDYAVGLTEVNRGDVDNNERRDVTVGGTDGYLQATWDLDRLIFNKDELGIARETVRLSNLRDRVLDQVTRRYYERRRLQVDLELSPSTDLADRVRKELRIQELTADIDALTGGWFSKSLERLGTDPY